MVPQLLIKTPPKDIQFTKNKKSADALFEHHFGRIPEMNSTDIESKKGRPELKERLVLLKTGVE